MSGIKCEGTWMSVTSPSPMQPKQRVIHNSSQRKEKKIMKGEQNTLWELKLEKEGREREERNALNREL